jgi:L-serine dehydratase
MALSLQKLLEDAASRNVPFSQIVLEVEAEEADLSPEKIKERLARRLEVMRQARSQGLAKPLSSRSGLVSGAAYTYAKGNKRIVGGLFSEVVGTALAVAEENACMGRIVAAPTAGSCGILPAALLPVAEEYGLADEALVRGLAVAGGIGLVIESLATLSGAEGGCQAECGSASAMAAGALVELMGGEVAQIGYAVSFALKNVMGLVCDPVEGLVEIPCIKRNVLGAVGALAASEMALAGLKSALPVDEVIKTMGQVGRAIPESLRETSLGGLALTYRKLKMDKAADS